VYAPWLNARFWEDPPLAQHVSEKAHVIVEANHERQAWLRELVAPISTGNVGLRGAIWEMISYGFEPIRIFGCAQLFAPSARKGETDPANRNVLYALGLSAAAGAGIRLPRLHGPPALYGGPRKRH